MPSKQALTAQQVYNSTLKMFEDDFREGDASSEAVLLKKLAGLVPMILDAVSPDFKDENGVLKHIRLQERSDVEGRVRQLLSVKSERKTSTQGERLILRTVCYY